MGSQRRWLLALLSFALLQHVSASSRSSSRRSSLNSRRKKRRKRQTDPHDVSSSSPSFVPLVFTEDEREEDILSALARLEMEGDDEEEEPPKQVKQKSTVKKTKRVVKKAMSGVRMEEKGGAEQKIEQRDEQLKAARAVAPAKEEQVKVETEATEAVPAKSNTPGPTNDQQSLTALEAMRRSPPRQQNTETLPHYPPRPVWQRPEQTTQKRPPMTPSAITAPSFLASPPTSTRPTWSYNSATVVSQQQKKQARQQSQMDSSTTTRWVRKFLSARPKDTLLPIPREYLSDGFNLVHLAPIVEKIGRMEGYVPTPLQNSDTTFPLFKAALRLILSNGDEPTPLSVQRAAEVLYTLVHARYVISPRGLDTVRRVLRRSDGTVDPVFGRCPRMRCRGMPLLPCGDSDSFDPRNSVSTRAKRYCSCCGEKFYMWDSKTDESAWGPSFCHLFLMIYGSAVFPDLQKRNRDATNATEVEPSIFGFKVHPASQLRYSVGD